MAKTKISQFDAVASNNTDINSVNVSEGCPPSGINDALRSLASLLKKQEVGTDAMTSPDINGGTIDGATIGASSASTGAFTNLSVSGAFTSQGIDDNANATAITINSSEQVGIGTTSPASAFHVSSSSYPQIEIDDQASRNYAMGVTSSSFRIRDVTGTSDRLTINSSGDVGIGTSSPSQKLDVTGTTNTIVNSKTSTSTALGGFTAFGNSTSHLKVFQFGSSYGGTTFAGLTGNNQSIIEAQDASSLVIATQGGTPDIVFAPARTARVTIKNSGDVGIGTASPSDKLHISGTNTGGFRFTNSNNSDAISLFVRGGNAISSTSDDAVLNVGSRSDNSIITTGRVGIGTTSPIATLHTASGSSGRSWSSGVDRVIHEANSTNIMQIVTSTTGTAGINFADTDARAVSGVEYNHNTKDMNIAINEGSGTIKFFNTSLRMLINPAGNVFIGNTAEFVDGTASTDIGIQLNPIGLVISTRNQGISGIFGRQGTDGDIIQFRKNGTEVGSIGNASSSELFIDSGSNGTGLSFRGNHMRPRDNGSDADNAVSLGNSSFRFDDIVATNGSIVTSDRNEKQDIEELSDAEKKVAVVAKGLMRKFRWKNRVEEKGDDARTHFGIIAQDLQDAFTAESLDASRYGMFCSDTWWELDGEIYKTKEEAPEGATEKTRLGVRYSELLAFIISAI